jgi:hypothetical protein
MLKQKTCILATPLKLYTLMEDQTSLIPPVKKREGNVRNFIINYYIYSFRYKEGSPGSYDILLLLLPPPLGVDKWKRSKAYKS